jgi:hypothetical protein
MVALLRRGMASWRWWVTVAVVCLAFYALAIWLGPLIRLWPWEARVVVFGLAAIAGLVATLIIALALGWCLAFLLLGKELNRRTPKAREKFADSLMSCSTALLSATLIGPLVFPFTAFIQTMASGADPLSALVAWWQPNRWSDWHTGMFLVLFWLPFGVGLFLRKRALDVYDELSPPAPAVDPITQGAHERPSVREGGPTAHTSTNGGAQRRRRPRGK